MPNLDPFARAWREYDENGLDGLNNREAPLIVISATDLLDDEQLDQVIASAAAEGHELVPDHLRWMVAPDAKPLTPGHLNVIGGRQIPYHDASDVERGMAELLTNATRQHINGLLRPAYGTSVHIFGEEVPTLHTHVVQHRTEEDGYDWKQNRPFITVGVRHLVRAHVGFDLVPGRKEQIVRRMSRGILRYTLAA